MFCASRNVMGRWAPADPATRRATTTVWRIRIRELRYGRRALNMVTGSGGRHIAAMRRYRAVILLAAAAMLVLFTRRKPHNVVTVQAATLHDVSAPLAVGG